MCGYCSSVSVNLVLHLCFQVIPTAFQTALPSSGEIPGHIIHVAPLLCLKHRNTRFLMLTHAYYSPQAYLILSSLLSSQFRRCTCRNVSCETLTDRDGSRVFAFSWVRAKHGGSLCSELVSDLVDNSTKSISHSHPCCIASGCDRPLIESRHR